MTTTQKVIKYIAISFAIFLIIAIFSTILKLTIGAGIIFGIIKNNDKNISSEMITKEIVNQELKELDIEISYSNLQIKNGETFYIQTNNNDIKCVEKNNKLEIKENNKHWSIIDNTISKIIIYIPSNFILDEVSIKTGAGKIEIDNLSTVKLKIELGAGEVIINKLYAYNNAKINTGAGKLIINNGFLRDLKLDMGVGTVNITAAIPGDSDIDAGIGNLKINLLPVLDFYKLKVSKGIGNIKVGNEEIKNDTIIGDGENYIKINGGIGSINIKINDGTENL